MKTEPKDTSRRDPKDFFDTTAVAAGIANDAIGEVSRAEFSALVERQRKALDAALAVNRLAIQFVESSVRQQAVGWQQLIDSVAQATAALTVYRNGHVIDAPSDSMLISPFNNASARLRDLSGLSLQVNSRAFRFITGHFTDTLCNLVDAASGRRAATEAAAVGMRQSRV